MGGKGRTWLVWPCCVPLNIIPLWWYIDSIKTKDKTNHIIGQCQTSKHEVMYQKHRNFMSLKAHSPKMQGITSCHLSHSNLTQQSYFNIASPSRQGDAILNTIPITTPCTHQVPPSGSEFTTTTINYSDFSTWGSFQRKKVPALQSAPIRSGRAGGPFQT